MNCWKCHEVSSTSVCRNCFIEALGPAIINDTYCISTYFIPPYRAGACIETIEERYQSFDKRNPIKIPFHKEFSFYYTPWKTLRKVALKVIETPEFKRTLTAMRMK